MSSETTTSQRRRLWSRYSLRTLFIALTVLCIVGGYWINKTYRQRAAVRRFYALTSDASPNRDKDLVTMGYRHQGRDEFYKPIIPKWLHPLRDLIGEEAFGEVTGVQDALTPRRHALARWQNQQGPGTEKSLASNCALGPWQH